MGLVYSKEDFYSYAKGVLRITNILRGIVDRAKKHDKPVLLVVPSRGAVTPMFAAIYASTGEAVVPGLTPLSQLQGRKKFDDAEVHLLLLPLTADTGKRSVIPEHLEEHHRKAYERTEQIIKHIRAGGMHILRVLLSDPSEREKDRAFRVFTRILELEGREDLADFYRRFHLDSPAVVMIDTAISGSAVSHILSGARREGLRLLPIIVADAHGSKLKTPEKRAIQSYLNYLTGKRGRITLEQVVVPVKKLLGENRGAALQGLWAAIYPQIVGQLVTERLPGLGGSWHVLPRMEPYVETYNSFIRALFTAIDEVSGRAHGFERAYEKFKEKYRLYKENVVRHRVENGKQLVRETGLPQYPFRNAYVRENNNRVIHIHFPLQMWKRRIKPHLFK